MLTLKVDGMTCGHCAQAVTKAVEAVPHVDRALVDLSAGEVVVEGTGDVGLIRKAIEDAGYSVRGSVGAR
jgi:copper chaperone